MITLKTNTQFQIPHGRVIRTEYIYLKIERLEVTKEHITPTGYYYFIDSMGREQILDRIVRRSISWSLITTLESGFFPVLTSTTSIKSNLTQRILESTLSKIQEEGNTNYGTVYTDWSLLEE